MTFYEKAAAQEQGKDFSFLAGYRKGNVSAYDLLHGFCNVFAKVLNEEFGYRINEITDEYGTLIHFYALGKEKGRPVYIDVRGKTDDYSEFIEEFEYFTTKEDSRINTVAADPNSIYVPETMYVCSRDAYELSREMIKNFRVLYAAEAPCA